MVETAKSWFKENQALVLALLAQLIVGGVYLVNLEARVATLETRGSPHLTEINTRLTTLEKVTESNSERLKSVTDIMTRRLNINP